MFSTKKTILIVEDTVSNIDIALGILNEYDTIVATSGEEALAILEEESVDLILLDIVMPGIDGFEVCKRVKKNPALHRIPIVFITAKNDEDTIEEAFAIGGIDYVTKPFRSRELKARVKMHLEFQSMIQHLDFITSYDMLTGIYNRRKFIELSQIMFNSDLILCAVMIDIDKFKSINDTYGHHNGDIVLKNIAQKIAENLPVEAVLGRLGGEEFAVIMKCNDKSEIMAVVERIRKAVESYVNVLEEGQNLQSTISSGVALKNDETKTLDILLQKADHAMYEAKETGRNRSIFRV